MLLGTSVGPVWLCGSNTVVWTGVGLPNAPGNDNDCAGGQGPKTCGKHSGRNRGHG